MTITDNTISKIIIGTAQFGLEYGIANKFGATGREEAHSILKLASNRGISQIDTAQAYGASEKIIGSFKQAKFQVTSKVGRFPEPDVDWGVWFGKKIEASQSIISQHELTTVLLHDVSDLLGSNRNKALDAIAKSALEHPNLHFGASLYDPAEWHSLREIPELRVFQTPFSVFDTRFRRAGIFEDMKTLGKNVTVRSVFLQGLLAMDSSTIPPRFDPWQSVLKNWSAFCGEIALSKIAAAASFALTEPHLGGAIIGFDSSTQLQGLITDLEGITHEPISFPDFGNLAPELIDPRRWDMH